MRKYQCHKTVEAAAIVTVHVNREAKADDYVVFVDDKGERCVQPAKTDRGDLFARGVPKVGDYLVKYDDGYMAWSPKQAFEDGYTLIREASDTRHPTLQAPAAVIRPSAGSHQKPSVGRIVNYHDGRTGYCQKPAIITRVFAGGTVSLCVFPSGDDDQIVPVLVRGVALRGPTNTGAGWSWPERT